MSIQSTSFNPLAKQRSFANPTIDSGINAGGVFDGRGHDFLDPDDILKTVDGFSQGVTPTSSSNSSFLPLGTNPIAQNANSFNVLSSTNGNLNTIFAPNFGNSLLNPSPRPNQDLSNFNPLIWENPNSTNVLLGTMDAINKIFGGNGLFQPNPVPPLFPSNRQPQPPFNDFAAPVAQQAEHKVLGGNGLQPNPAPPLFPPNGQPQSSFNNFAAPVAQQAEHKVLGGNGLQPNPAPPLFPPNGQPQSSFNNFAAPVAQQAEHKVLGGNGLQPNPAPPLFPPNGQPQSPFNNFAAPVAQQAEPAPLHIKSDGAIHIGHKDPATGDGANVSTLEGIGSTAPILPGPIPIKPVLPDKLPSKGDPSYKILDLLLKEVSADGNYTAVELKRLSKHPRVKGSVYEPVLYTLAKLADKYKKSVTSVHLKAIANKVKNDEFLKEKDVKEFLPELAGWEKAKKSKK
jgi:hypothetical protein